MWKPTVTVVESSNTVSQHNSEEMRGTPHASSQTRLTPLSDDDDDEPCEIHEETLGGPTRGTDEEDTKVGGVLRLTVSSSCFILTRWIQRITTQYDKTFYQQQRRQVPKI